MSEPLVRSLSIPEVKIFLPEKHEDERGFFSETYNAATWSFSECGLNFVQDNHAASRAPYTVRGLHFQVPPYAQAKLVRVTSGSIFDVAVDIRTGSPTFGQWCSAIISAREWNQILIPIGFAHGLMTLAADTEVQYKVTNYYAPRHEMGIRWNDEDIDIPWGVPESQVVLSERDWSQPLLRNLPVVFSYQGGDASPA